MEKDFNIISNPSHYNQTEVQPIDVINDWRLKFNLGNVVKYIARHKHKGKPLEDLNKAKYYLDDYILRLISGQVPIEYVHISAIDYVPEDVVEMWELPKGLCDTIIHLFNFATCDGIDFYSKRSRVSELRKSQEALSKYIGELEG